MYFNKKLQIISLKLKISVINIVKKRDIKILTQEKAYVTIDKIF